MSARTTKPRAPKRSKLSDHVEPIALRTTLVVIVEHAQRCAPGDASLDLLRAAHHVERHARALAAACDPEGLDRLTPHVCEGHAPSTPATRAAVVERQIADLIDQCNREPRAFHAAATPLIAALRRLHAALHMPNMPAPTRGGQSE